MPQVQPVGVALAHGSDAEECNSELLTELAAGLAAQGARQTIPVLGCCLTALQPEECWTPLACRLAAAVENERQMR